MANVILDRINCNERDFVEAENKLPSPLHSFAMLPTDENQIKNVSKTLNNNTSTVWDGISGNIYKIRIGVLARPISILCNACFDSGSFPEL